MEENEQTTITRCEARRGILWWTESFYMVKEEAGVWLGIGAAYLILLFLPVMVISFLVVQHPNLMWAMYLPTIVIPCFVVGFVAAGWTQTRRQKPKIKHLFSGFKADAKTLLGIGLAIAILNMATIFIVNGILGGNYYAILNEAGEDINALMALYASPRFLGAMLVMTVLITLILLAGWLAPMLVVFQHAGAIQALKGSLKAALINWRALAVYAVIPMVAVTIFSILFTILAVIIAMIGGMAGGAMLSGVMMLLLFVLMPWLVSLMMLTAFVAYCDIFHAKDNVFPRPKLARSSYK